MAGNAVVDWLFMLGILAIGLPLVLGIGVRIGVRIAVRIAASIGVVMLLVMYSAVVRQSTIRSWTITLSTQ